MAKNRQWTEEDDGRLIELRTAGQSTPQIAKSLKRTEAATANRISILKNRGAFDADRHYQNDKPRVEER